MGFFKEKFRTAHTGYVTKQQVFGGGGGGGGGGGMM